MVTIFNYTKTDARAGLPWLQRSTAVEQPSPWRSVLGRRRLLQHGTVGAAALGLAACSSKSNNNNGTSATQPASSAVAGGSPAAVRAVSPAAVSGVSGAVTAAAGQKAKSGGTLRYVIASDITPKTIPHTVSPTNDILYSCIYDTLIRYKTDVLEATPQLADSWEFNADKTQLTFHLHKGVLFHSGKPLTSAAVKWNIERVGDPALGSQLLNFSKWVVKSETPDDTTLVLTFDQPRPSMLDMFENLFIAEPESIQGTIDGKTFIGTGPFTFKDWQPGDHYSFVKNPAYFRPGLPYLDAVEVKIVPDTQAQLITVQSGAAEIAENAEPRDARSLQSDKKYQVIVPTQWVGLWYVGVDVKAQGLGDKRVRQAIGFAIDRKRMVDTVLFGFGEPTVLPWQKNSPAFDPAFADAFSYDLTKAKQLLNAAGVSSLDLSYIVSNAYLPTHGIAQVLQDDLSKIGIKADINKLDHPQYLPKLTGGKMNGIWSGTVGFMHMTPSTLFVQSFPYRVPNSSNFDTPEYRSLIDASLNTPEAGVKDVYHRLDQMLVDEAFMLPITPTVSPRIAAASVRDYLFSRSARVVIEAMWLAK